MKNLTILTTGIFALVGMAGPVWAIPHIWGVWSWEHSEPVHLLVVPNGEGPPLAAAEYFGGQEVDATIRIQLWGQGDSLPDPPPPAPVPNYPGEDIWLEIFGVIPCSGGSTADGPTDEDGWFTFSNPLAAGGWNDPEADPPLVYVLVNGSFLFDQEDQIIAPLVALNSPDIDGDLDVDLVDLAQFSQDYLGNYSFRSDYYWDGALNLLDLVWMSRHFGEACP